MSVSVALFKLTLTLVIGQNGRIEFISLRSMLEDNDDEEEDEEDEEDDEEDDEDSDDDSLPIMQLGLLLRPTRLLKLLLLDMIPLPTGSTNVL
jgi:hypothetical protein